MLHTAGGLAGICSEHVSHGSRVGMEGIHRGEDVEARTECRDGRVWRPRCSCPCEAPQRSCCQVAPSTLPASPAPPPRANAHMLRHGKLRPRHPLPHRDHVHHPFLVAAGRTKPGSTRKVPCRHGRCREARALEIRVHGSIHGKFQPVTASVPCAGRALRPRIPPSRAINLRIQFEIPLALPGFVLPAATRNRWYTWFQ